jgi:hypothetical protein
MPTAQTRITTVRASRYLVQLCKHLNQINHRSRHRHLTRPGHGPEVERIEWTNNDGRIVFAFGQCDLHAADDSLTIELTADDTNALSQMQDMLAARLVTIGRRDNLDVRW